MRIWLAITAVASLAAVPATAWTDSSPGRGLAVRQARMSHLTGVLRVLGFEVVDRRGRVRLRDRRDQSPAVWRGAALIVDGVTPAEFEPLARGSGARWSVRPRPVYGRLRHGQLVFAANVR